MVSYQQFFIVIGAVLWFMRYDRRKIRPFFYRIALKEPPIEFGAPYDFIAWEWLGIKREFVYSQLFKSKKDYIVVPRNVKIAESPSFGEPVITYARNSKGSNAYKALAAAILKG